MATLLVAHGTRNPHGVTMIRGLAAAMARILDEAVLVSFVDVLGPAPDEVLQTLHHEPTVAVPALLSSGHHVRSDLPNFVAASRHPAVVVARPLGPAPELAHAMLDRLVESGWQPHDSVVFAAAGSRDAQAQKEIVAAASMLSGLLDKRVSVAFAAPCRDGSGFPSVPDAVTRARQTGARRVAVASYLLADGLFQDRLRESGADTVSEPLGLHPGVVQLACRRQGAAKAAFRMNVA